MKRLCDIMISDGQDGTSAGSHRGVFVRFSDTEWGSMVQAFARDHPVAARRPTLAEWIRDLMVAHAGTVLEVEVTRSSLQHARGGAPQWKRWRLACAERPDGAGIDDERGDDRPVEAVEIPAGFPQAPTGPATAGT